jgi:2-oxoglutarate dehydrogenase E2 component (dihydrolipoamide succinyltransferase)
MTNIKVPAIGESITEVTLIKWLKKNGDYVERDEVIAEFESEKATFEVNAEKAGVLKTSAIEGDTLNIGDTLAQIDETAQKSDGSTAQSGISITAPAAPVPSEKVNATSAPEPAVAAGKGTLNIKIRV